jgi:hypothetical protein
MSFFDGERCEPSERPIVDPRELLLSRVKVVVRQKGLPIWRLPINQIDNFSEKPERFPSENGVLCSLSKMWQRICNKQELGSRAKSSAVLCR